MTTPPARPKLYHITHVDNLAAILDEGFLVSDREMIRRGGPTHTIGMSAIKKRRVEELLVTSQPGTKVGDYVPFYFCPRSIMLYVIWRANNPNLLYRGGQGPIVHLEADLNQVVAWADLHGVRWAYSLSNAGAYVVQFRASLVDLDQLNWPAIAATDFRSPEVSGPKQAEFLVYERFPFELIKRIGVASEAVRGQVEGILERAAHRPIVEVLPAWYF